MTYALQQSFAISGYGGPPVLVTPTPEKMPENKQAKNVNIIPLHKESVVAQGRLGAYLAATVSMSAMSGAMRASNDNKAHYAELYKRIEKNLRDKQNQKAELEAKKIDEPVIEDIPELDISAEADDADKITAERQHHDDVLEVEQKNAQAQQEYDTSEQERIAELSDVERTIIELETTLSYLREKAFGKEEAEEFLAFTALEGARQFTSAEATPDGAAQPGLNFVAMHHLSEQIGTMLPAEAMSPEDLMRQQFHANAMGVTQFAPHAETASQLDANTQKQLQIIAVNSQFNASLVKGAADMLETPAAGGVIAAGGPQEPTNEDKALGLIEQAKAEQDAEEQRRLSERVFVKPYELRVLDKHGKQMRIRHESHLVDLKQELQGSDRHDLNERQEKFEALRDKVQEDHIDTIAEQGKDVHQRFGHVLKVFVVNGKTGTVTKDVQAKPMIAMTDSPETQMGLFQQSMAGITGQEGVNVGVVRPMHARHFEFEAA